MNLRFVVMFGAIALAMPLVGCQTTQQSAENAQMTCDAQGLNPGTERYRRCVSTTYANNRQQSAEASNAAAAGVAAGLIGGAVVGAAIADDHRYSRRGYYRCGWGCY